jgi:SAM-dependent methyltransferase
MPSTEVNHRDHEYDSRLHVLLQGMQERHFWYRGRHRFLLEAVHRQTGRAINEAGARHVVDLGGGCGGWLGYLLVGKRFDVGDVVLADSSASALAMAAKCLPLDVERRQVDLMDLPWSHRWDLAFLLDVLEHLPDQEAILTQIRDALAPGGLLFVTVPALRCFWTWNDDFRPAGIRLRFRVARHALFHVHLESSSGRESVRDGSHHQVEVGRTEARAGAADALKPPSDRQRGLDGHVRRRDAAWAYRPVPVGDLTDGGPSTSSGVTEDEGRVYRERRGFSPSAKTMIPPSLRRTRG